MQMMDELFEKVVYESNDYKEIQKSIDHELEQVLSGLCEQQQIDRESVRNAFLDVLYHAEREMFGMGFGCGVKLMHESGIVSNDIHDL
ncbi:MAG: hypothetical protein IJ833_08610 [Lachnospiraceae bacterium]|nr:hypothetical protein [Lachnospiraceae bacterium]